MDQPPRNETEFFCHRCNRHFQADAQPPDVRCSVCNDDFVEAMPSSSSAQSRESHRFGFTFPTQFGRLSRPRVNPVNRNNFTVQVSSDEGGANILTGFLPLGDLSESSLFPDTLADTIYQIFDMLPSGPPPASSDDIRRLHDYEITQEDIDNQRECPICMESFHLSEQTKCLPCKHTFHERCIMQWLELRGTCPVCRRTLQGADTSRQEFFLPIDGRNMSGVASAVGGLATRQQTNDARSAIFSADSAVNPFQAFLQQSGIDSSGSSQDTSFLASSGTNIPPRNGAVVRATVSARIQPVTSSGQQSLRPASRSRIRMLRASAPLSVRTQPANASTTPFRAPTLQNRQSRMSSRARIFNARPFPEQQHSSNLSLVASGQQQDAAGEAERSAPLQDDLD